MHRTMAHRYSTFKTDQGYEVRGLLHPVGEGQIPAYQWATPRLVFRTSPESLARPGTIIIDSFGRRLILGSHGDYQVAGNPLYKVFRLVEATKHVSWQRKTTIIDPVTKLPKKETMNERGPIWVAIEPLGRLDGDRDVRVREDGHQIVTAADVSTQRCDRRTDRPSSAGRPRHQASGNRLMKVKYLNAAGGTTEAREGDGFDKILNEFQEEMERKVKTRVARLTAERAKRFSRAMMKAWKPENEEVFLTINRLMQNNTKGEINVTDLNQGGGGDFAALDPGAQIKLQPPKGRVEWKKLHPSTIRRKRETLLVETVV